MPLIMPIKDLRNTTESSNLAHKEQEPIFITKNGYSDLVVMSSDYMINLQELIVSTRPSLNPSGKRQMEQKQSTQR